MQPVCESCGEPITDVTYLLTDWSGRELEHTDAVHVACAEGAGTMAPDAAHYTLIQQPCPR